MFISLYLLDQFLQEDCQVSRSSSIWELARYANAQAPTPELLNQKLKRWGQMILMHFKDGECCSRSQKLVL